MPKTKVVTKPAKSDILDFNTIYQKSKLLSPERIWIAFNKYKAMCKAKRRIPEIAGFAYYMKIPMRELKKYSMGRVADSELSEQYRAVMSIITCYIESKMLQNSLIGTYNSQVAIRYLQQHAKWRDKIDPLDDDMDEKKQKNIINTIIELSRHEFTIADNLQKEMKTLKA